MKTNRTLKLITLTAAIFGFAATSFAQNSADATAAAGANIIAPITITQVTDMYFGDIVQTTAENAVTITAAASTVRTAEITTSLLTAQTGNPTAAEFTITGENGYTYSIDLPDSINLTGTGDAMEVNGFSMNLDETGNTFGASAVTLYVGATLNVNADQAVGEYTGEFEVTVAYE